MPSHKTNFKKVATVWLELAAITVATKTFIVSVAAVVTTIVWDLVATFIVSVATVVATILKN